MWHLPHPGTEPVSPALVVRFFTTEPPGMPPTYHFDRLNFGFFSNNKKEMENRWFCLHAKLLQLCLTLCDPMDCSPPGFPIHGILQARILEWVIMPSSRESSQPGIEPEFPALQVDSLLSESPEKPYGSTHESKIQERGQVWCLLFGNLLPSGSSSN